MWNVYFHKARDKAKAFEMIAKQKKIYYGAEITFNLLFNT